MRTIRQKIPSLSGYNFQKDTEVFMVALIKKFESRRNIHFPSIFGGLNKTPDVVRHGNLVVYNEAKPKILAPCDIKSLLSVFNDYYLKAMVNIENAFQMGQNGELATQAQLFDDIDNINKRFRWFDFNWTPNQVDPVNDQARTDAVGFLALKLGIHPEQLTDDKIYKLYVTPAGEVTSLSSILQAGAMDKEMGRKAVCEMLLLEHNATDPQIQSQIQQRKYAPIHPLNKTTIQVSLPDEKLKFITAMYQHLSTA